MVVIVCPHCRNQLSAMPTEVESFVACPYCQSAVPAPLSLPTDEAPPRRPAGVKRKDEFDFEGDADNESPRNPRRKIEDDTPKWLLAFAGLPLILVLVGGLIGGLCGGLGMAINSVVAKQRGMALPVKLAVMIAITIASIGLYVVVVTFLFANVKWFQRG